MAPMLPMSNVIEELNTFKLALTTPREAAAAIADLLALPVASRTFDTMQVRSRKPQCMCHACRRLAQLSSVHNI